MLEKPTLDEQALIQHVRDAYGVTIRQATFLPIGADTHTAVYRASDESDRIYFLKIRRGDFNEVSVLLPRLLAEQGIRQVIVPFATRAGEYWTHWDAYTVILYPFITGRNGFEAALSDEQWFAFGRAMRALHALNLPAHLAEQLPRETYSPRWRESVKKMYTLMDGQTFVDPVAVQVAKLMREKRNVTLDLLQRTDRLALALQQKQPAFVVCHTDAHAGNVMLADEGSLYIVDWDSPLLAPKERDLMFIGGAQGFVGCSAPDEERLFYLGYGDAPVDLDALAYYRYARIVEDIALFCEVLLLTDAGGDDRAQSLHYLMSNYQPGGTIEIAYQSDRSG
jgi:spectinomycin phosphotransferase